MQKRTVGRSHHLTSPANGTRTSRGEALTTTAPELLQSVQAIVREIQINSYRYFRGTGTENCVRFNCTSVSERKRYVENDSVASIFRPQSNPAPKSLQFLLLRTSYHCRSQTAALLSRWRGSIQMRTKLSKKLANTTADMSYLWKLQSETFTGISRRCKKAKFK